MTRPGNIPAQAGIELRVCLSRGGRHNHKASEAMKGGGGKHTVTSMVAYECIKRKLLSEKHYICKYLKKITNSSTELPAKFLLLTLVCRKPSESKSSK